MALIVEAIGRWTDAESPGVEVCLEAFCRARRERRPEPEILATLPDDARLGGAIALAAIALLESALDRRLELVVDRVMFREDAGPRRYLGVGIGRDVIERVDDLGASRRQAESASAALLALLRGLAPERSLSIVLD